MKQEFDFQTHFQTWVELIIGNKTLREETEKVIQKLREVRDTTDRRILPEGRNVFRAFRETPVYDVQYVLLGMDPYNNIYKNKPSACGLSFVTENGYVNPSLEILSTNLGIHPNGFKDKMLNKGVLLLNAYLTTELGRAGAHKTIWNEFSKTMITSISKYKPNLTWVLLGNDAKSYKEYIIEGTVYTGIHPAALARQGIKGKHDDYQRLFKEIQWI